MKYRFFALVFLGGFAGVVLGSYHLYVQFGVSPIATTLTLSQLDQSTPSNRNLIVTEGEAAVESAVTSYKTKYYAKVSGSDVIFVPVFERGLSRLRTLPPSLLLKMSTKQFEVLKAARGILAGGFQGLRIPQIELETGVKSFFEKKYGEDAIAHLTILDFERAPDKSGTPWQELLGGLGALALSLFIAISDGPSRKSHSQLPTVV